MEIEIAQIGMAVFSAAAYSIVFYAKHKEGSLEEDFDPKKFASTLIVGVGVGVGYGLSGVDVTQAGIEEQLAAYAGTVAIVESGLKYLYRRFLN